MYLNQTIISESEIPIKAGTMVVLPSRFCETASPWMPDSDQDPDQIWPDYLLICEGQTLRRENYPGWSSEYQGGFYDFTLPNLKDKFIIGINLNHQPILGTGCIYFRDEPVDTTPKAHPHVMDEI